MTVQKFKNKKVLFVLLSALIIVVGLLAFVLSYGISLGWDVLLAWFGSKYAILLYIFIGCYVILLIWILLYEKIRKLR